MGGYCLTYYKCLYLWEKSIASWRILHVVLCMLIHQMKRYKDTEISTLMINENTLSPVLITLGLWFRNKSIYQMTVFIVLCVAVLYWGDWFSELKKRCDNDEDC